MNRRSFIAKAVAGPAAVPLFGQAGPRLQATKTLWDEIQDMRATNPGMSVEDAKRVIHGNWMVYHEAALRLGCSTAELTHLPVEVVARVISK